MSGSTGPETHTTTGQGRSSTLVNRNVTIRGRRTSLRLEPTMWDALTEVARRERLTIHELCSEIQSRRRESTLTAAIRVHILIYFREAATEQGHDTAGHGRRAENSGHPAGGGSSGRPSAASDLPRLR